MKVSRLLIFVFSLSVCLIGCSTVDSERSASTQQNAKQQKLADLNRQKADAAYEIQLRQDEMKEMETTAKKPGVVGVSDEWLKRQNQLKEEIIKLRVKVHDLELQIDALAKP